jgi:hypothetical protein
MNDEQRAAVTVHHSSFITHHSFMANYHHIDDNPEASLWACAFYLAQDIGEPKPQAEILARVTEHYLAAGEVDLATQAVEPLYDVADSHEREQRFAQLAARAARHGHDDLAHQLADACADVTWHDAARHDLALAQAARGAYEAARETALALGYPEPTLIEIARRSLAENEAQARAIADEVEEPRARAVILWELASHHAAAGQTAEALTLLNTAAGQLPEIDLPDEQVEALCALGLRYAALEQRDQARDLLEEAQGVAEDAADDHQLLRVAESWLALGDLEKAVYVAEEIDLFDTSWFFANVAAAAARAQGFDQAHKLLAPLKDNHHKGRGYLLVGLAYQEQDDEANFRAHLEKAFTLGLNSPMRTNEDVTLRHALLGAISSEYLNAGDEAKAREIASAMPACAACDEAWAKIAAREADDGRFRDALKTVANISAAVSRAQAQAALALRIAQFEARTTKSWPLVHDALNAIDDKAFSVRLTARLEVAGFLTQQGADDEAAQLRHTAQEEAAHHPRPAVAAHGLAEIAAHTADPDTAAQLFSAAIQQTASLSDLYETARVLLDLAEKQEKIGGAPDEAAQAVLQQHLPV